MPLREYECHVCNITFEKLHMTRGADEAARKRGARCPVCKKKRKRVAVSVPSPPQFKGKGFYATDYK